MAIAFATSVCAIAAATEPAQELGEREKSFVDQIAANDLAEIELSKLIRTKTASAAVRRLARTILTEDTANYEQVFKLCLRRQYAIAPQLDERHRQLLREVRAARSSRALGRKYIDTLLVDDDHTASCGAVGEEQPHGQRDRPAEARAAVERVRDPGQ